MKWIAGAILITGIIVGAALFLRPSEGDERVSELERCLSLGLHQLVIWERGGEGAFWMNEFDRLGCEATLDRAGSS
jgi:hypothetical protein